MRLLAKAIKKRTGTTLFGEAIEGFAVGQDAVCKWVQPTHCCLQPTVLALKKRSDPYLALATVILRSARGLQLIQNELVEKNTKEDICAKSNLTSK